MMSLKSERVPLSSGGRPTGFGGQISPALSRLLAWASATIAIAVAAFSAPKSAFPIFVTPFKRFDLAIGVRGVSTVDARVNTVDFAWAQIGKQPIFGVGFSGAGVTYGGATATHNMLLLAWCQGGTLMFVAVAIMTASAIYSGWRKTGDGLFEATFAASVAVLFFARSGPSLDCLGMAPVMREPSRARREKLRRLALGQGVRKFDTARGLSIHGSASPLVIPFGGHQLSVRNLLCSTVTSRR